MGDRERLEVENRDLRSEISVLRDQVGNNEENEEEGAA